MRVVEVEAVELLVPSVQMVHRVVNPRSAPPCVSPQVVAVVAVEVRSQRPQVVEAEEVGLAVARLVRLRAGMLAQRLQVVELADDH